MIRIRARRPEPEMDLPMATFELSSEEAEILHNAVQSYLGELQDEIAHTDDYDLRQTLQHKREVLESIVTRIAGS